MVDRLADDHANARALAEGLAALPGLYVDLETVQSNMVYADTEPGAAGAVVAGLAAAGVLINPVGPSRVRFVTHKDVDAAAVAFAVAAAGKAAGRAWPSPAEREH
jgi:threonine aldolase